MDAYKQFLSFRFSFNNIKWTNCVRMPFCMTAKPLVAYQKCTGGAFLGGALEISYRLHLAIIESIGLQSKYVCFT